MHARPVYRAPRRFITYPSEPPPYGFVAVSFLAHMLCFGGALALSAFLGSRIDESKVYIVNLVPATPSLGSATPAAPPAPSARVPETPRPSPPLPKAEEKAPPSPPAPKAEEKAPPKPPRPEPARPEPPPPERPPERVVSPPPRVPEVAAVRPTPDPSELALPRRAERAEKENPSLPAPNPRPIERTLPPPPPVTPPVTAPVTPAAPARLPEPPRLPVPPAPPTAPAASPAPPAAVASRPGAEPQRPGRPNAPTDAASRVSVDASDFPFTYYLRQLHAKVSEQWRRPPLVSSEQSSTVIYFEITREGQMRGEPRIKQSSGNELYDQAALRAVVGSTPFPPLPREFPGQYLQVNFGFDPGLDKG
jgi:TonB family protein